MYHLLLSDEQLEFRDTVRDFVAREIKPLSLNSDRLQAAEPLPPEIADQTSQLGLRGLMLSEALGGAGAGHLTACIVAEELAAGDIGLANTMVQTAVLGQLLFERAMSPAQRERFLPLFLKDDRYHLAYAGREVDPDDGGWNYHRAASMAVEAPVKAKRVSGGDWVLDGEYAFVPNAPVAKLFAVRVTTGAETSILLVPADTPGLVITEASKAAIDPDGTPVYRWFHGTGGSLSFRNCHVPAANLLGEEGRCQLLAGPVGHGSPIVQALNLGVGRAAYEAAFDYSKLRIQGGRPIIQHQALGLKLADMAIRLETARNIVWKAAWAADHPEHRGKLSELPLQTVAQAYTATAMHETALLAAEFFGAMGVMKDMPLHKYVRDTLIFVHSDGRNGTAKLRISEALAGHRRA